MKLIQTWCFAVCLIAALPFISNSADVRWTDASGDHDWGNPLNWEGGALPTKSDYAIFPDSVNGDKSYTVNMNGDREVGSLSFSNSENPVLNGQGHELTIYGDYFGGGYRAEINTLLVFKNDARIQTKDGYSSNMKLNGGVRGENVVVRFSGNQNNAATVAGGIYSVSNTIASAAGLSFVDCIATNISLELSCGFSDGNGNRSCVDIYPSANITGMKLTVSGNGGTFRFRNEGYTNSANEHLISRIHNINGYFELAQQFYGGTNIVRVANYDNEPGSRCTINVSGFNGASVQNGRNCGFVFENLEKVNGVADPSFLWVHFTYPVCINSFGALDSQTNITPWPADGATSPEGIYAVKNASQTIDLQNDSEIYLLRHEYSNVDEKEAINLNEFDLTVGSGTLLFQSRGNKRFQSSGGALVFGGEDIRIAATDRNLWLDFACPVEWRKPSGSKVQYPSLVFLSAGATNTVFSGEDRIVHYGGINIDSGNPIAAVTFKGDSDRVFHGDIVGRNQIYNRGTGTLTFLGEDLRRTTGLYCESGITVVGNANGPAPNTILDGAVFILADNTEYTSARSITSSEGGVFCMEGDSASVQNHKISVPCIVEGGAPGHVGIFSTRGDFTPGTNYTVRLKIGETASSRMEINRYSPTSNGPRTVTICVTDITDGARVVRPGETFTAMHYNNISKFVPGDDIYVVENGSPGSLNTNAAQAVYDEEAMAVIVTGISSNCGTVIMFR